MKLTINFVCQKILLSWKMNEQPSVRKGVYPGQTFSSYEEAMAFIDAWAKEVLCPLTKVI